MLEIEYGFTRTFKGVSNEAARHRIKAALREEGFGVLTEIDVRATLKAKLNVGFPNYVILPTELDHKRLVTLPPANARPRGNDSIMPRRESVAGRLFVHCKGMDLDKHRAWGAACPIAAPIGGKPGSGKLPCIRMTSRVILPAACPSV